MKKNTLNLKNLNNFFMKINNYDDIKKINIFKELNISETAFVILRYLILKFFNEGTNNFLTLDIIIQLSNSDFFINSLSMKDFEIINKTNIDLGEEKLKLDSDFDYYEEYNNLNYLVFTKYIKELLTMGYINTAMDIENISIFKMLSFEVSLSFELLDFINTSTYQIEKFANNNPFINYDDFLKTSFTYIYHKQKFLKNKKLLSSKSFLYKKYKKEYINALNQLNNRKKLKYDFFNPLEKFFIEYNLNKKQQDIILAILKEQLEPTNFQFNNEEALIQLFFGDKEIPYVENLFDLKDDIIQISYEENIFSIEHSLLYYLNEKYIDLLIPTKVSENKKNIDLKNIKEHLKKVNDFDLIKPIFSEKDIILSPEIETIINLIKKQSDKKVLEKLNKWNIKNINFNSKILLSGKPGTGKTATAHVFGSILDKHLISFDCSKILDSYVGNSEKNVKAIFDSYRKIQEDFNYSPILLLNEADQFLSNRTNNSSDSSKMYNQMQNIFLEELEKFDGILIATTNLVENIDNAFSRRFNHKVELKLPSEEFRLKIWQTKLNNLPLIDNFDFSKLSSFELSGGQIEVVFLNTSLFNAVNNKDIFDEDDFLIEIKKEIDSSFETHNKIMGFNV